ncbi:hypothetical protein PHAVU_001G260700 [Phaseolus vulgaris]|uniref:Uncharacterized protein n=1 Tax=Phaseolus vulgaris TaxID=3885 RepID=V7D054_PHAVU|nr:hypothetical protein PHAVU_001G260700g [Phaseolus vulgaris]ESW35739.1 hypothetical protein PHAVU_001G260700g [Phaseolus vulgaris]
MAYSGIWAMCEGGYSLGNLVNNLQKRIKKNLSGSRIITVMEFESDWTKHRKSSAHTAQVIRSATSFTMPWSRRIPIVEGFYEFL